MVHIFSFEAPLKPWSGFNECGYEMPNNQDIYLCLCKELFLSTIRTWNQSIFVLADKVCWLAEKKTFFCIIVSGGLEFFGHSFAHDARLWYVRYVRVIRNQGLCRDKQAGYQLSHPSPNFLATIPFPLSHPSHYQFSHQSSHKLSIQSCTNLAIRRLPY